MVGIELRSDVWGTWRTEVWPAVLTAALVLFLSYKHDPNAKDAFRYLAEAGGIYLTGWGIYHLIRAPWKRHQKIHAKLESNATKEEVLSILNDVLNRTNQLSYEKPATVEEYAVWKNEVDAHVNWIQQVLNDKITPAEINVLVNGPIGPAMNFHGQFGLEQLHYKNYLHYLRQRASDLIGKYS